ncbi:hypothetical protein L596_020413 [Steinernema carpocapsae]|uniref:inorganic diphosphatase n=1 Tax=Steinernema carpocapsae TaxID=34508 RepID=A0A4U5MTG1_STECR|nr:hypothetical protein L596_020413 [Steinernema carpocapsae]
MSETERKRKLSDSDAGVAAAGILDEASETKIPKEEEPFEGEVFVPVPNHNTHVVEVGTLHTETYRCYLKDDDGNPLSLWHDVTLHAEKPTPESPQLYNMIVEVPRYSNARLEISHFEPMNPIVHAHADDGSLDYARNVFPFQGYPFNYGSFPQTFTDPNQKGDQPAPGDGDLVDAIEISQRRRKTGDIVKVKVLGAMAFIVNNRLDWKVVCVDAEDPISSKIKEVHQLEFVMPGIIRAIHEFFTLYNLPKGGGFTPVAFKGAYRKVDIAEQILGVSHSLWKNVIAQRQYGIPTETVIENRQPHGVVKASLKAWKQIVDSSPAHTKPAPEPPFVGKYYFVRTREES